MAITSPVPTARRRRRARLRGPRGIAALAVAVLLCGATASAEASAGVTVHTATGPFTVLGSQISQGGLSATFGSRTVTAMSLQQVLDAAGVDLTKVTSVRVAQAAPLTVDEIINPPASPAFIAVAAQKTIYCAPASGPTAISPANCIQTPAGLPIDVVVTAGSRPTATPGGTHLEVTASASATQVSIGETVVFSAVVSNPPPGVQLGYSWSFGDGITGDGPAPTHSYSANRDYQATVTVTGGGAAGQPTALVEIHVGHPIRTATGSGLGATSATGTGAGGTGSGRGGTGGGNHTGAGKGLTQKKPAPKPAVHPTPKVVPGAAARAAAAAARAAASQPVRGILLADIGSPLDLRLSPPPPAGSPGAARKSPGGSGGLAAVVGGLALALAIATLGGVRERRRVTLRPA